MRLFMIFIMFISLSTKAQISNDTSSRVMPFHPGTWNVMESGKIERVYSRLMYLSHQRSAIFYETSYKDKKERYVIQILDSVVFMAEKKPNSRVLCIKESFFDPILRNVTIIKVDGKTYKRIK